MAEKIVRHGGAGLIIDYGYAEPSGRGSLDGWSQRQPANIFTSPGKTDVAADVDFCALGTVAQQQGAEVTLLDQGEFLLALGITSRAEFFKSQTEPSAHATIEKSLQELTSPLKMGTLWKALILHKKKQHLTFYSSH